MAVIYPASLDNTTVKKYAHEDNNSLFLGFFSWKEKNWGVEFFPNVEALCYPVLDPSFSLVSLGQLNDTEICPF